MITGAIAAIDAAIVAPDPRVGEPAERAIGKVVPGQPVVALTGGAGIGVLFRHIPWVYINVYVYLCIYIDGGPLLYIDVRNASTRRYDGVTK